MSAPIEILLVEDSETQALQLRALLETEGYRVERAATAEAALETLNARLPDLVIADVHLPGMDGRELSRQIRLNGRTRAIPVLMLTSARDVDLERQGLESGADAYLSKSADPSLIRLRLKALLRRSGETSVDAPKAAAFSPFRRGRVIILHDSATTRVHLKEMLTQEGYAVEAVADEAALDAALTEPADCVLINLAAHAFDGLKVCGRLSESMRDEGGDPPRIMGLGGRGLLDAAFLVGADDVAPADASDDVLAVRVRALLRRKQLAEETRREEVEKRDRALALAASNARAAMVGALETANAELAGANSQLKEAQAKLVQAAKMASLGELVAGIAHEINNPLAFILGHHATVERLVGQIGGDEPSVGKAKDRLAAMRLGLQRIQDLVLNLRRFSRMDESAVQTLDVPDAIETVLALLAHKLGPGIEVRRRFEADRTVEGSPALLNQVVMNMISNAADAVDGQGVIEIATSEVDGRYRIAVSDSGPGVPPDLRDRIFEPFFTTKPVGSGTGLGLAIAYSVVEAHKGVISVEDSALGGAAFVISIPINPETEGREP
ncbi:response regulator [Caulobacter sp. NIBR2454]|uniref:response regulator n=1 Tax=Caulobacter sp. NIBR2454 TaxID=3015996 RepID=UPI0022B666DE|nr:response regulator [Caulobacter sp. NIBR2454]